MNSRLAGGFVLVCLKMVKGVLTAITRLDSHIANHEDRL